MVVVVAAHPAALTTVSETLYVPGIAYVTTGFCADENPGEPPAKTHEYVLPPLPEKFTFEF